MGGCNSNLQWRCFNEDHQPPMVVGAIAIHSHHQFIDDSRSMGRDHPKLWKKHPSGHMAGDFDPWPLYILYKLRRGCNLY